MGDITDTITRTLTGPCPDIDTRKKETDAYRAHNNLQPVVWASVKAEPDIIVNPGTVKKENGKLLRSLAYVFGHAEQSADLLDDANGSGLTFVEALVNLAKLATTADKAVVLSRQPSTESSPRASLERYFYLPSSRTSSSTNGPRATSSPRSEPPSARPRWRRSR